MFWGLWPNPGGPVGFSFLASWDPCHVPHVGAQLWWKVMELAHISCSMKSPFVFKHLYISISIFEIQLCIIFFDHILSRMSIFFLEGWWGEGTQPYQLNSFVRSPLEELSILSNWFSKEELWFCQWNVSWDLCFQESRHRSPNGRVSFAYIHTMLGISLF